MRIHFSPSLWPLRQNGTHSNTVAEQISQHFGCHESAAHFSWNRLSTATVTNPLTRLMRVFISGTDRFVIQLDSSNVLSIKTRENRVNFPVVIWPEDNVRGSVSGARRPPQLIIFYFKLVEMCIFGIKLFARKKHKNGNDHTWVLGTRYVCRVHDANAA